MDPRVGSVRAVATSAAEIARLAVGADRLPDSSAAAALLSSSFNVPSHGGFPIVREAFVSAMLATYSGVDHALVWADLVARPRAAVAYATVARGALEGFAKAHHLLSAEGPEQFVLRHLSVTKADMTFPARYSQFRDFSGKILDGRELGSVHATIAEDLGLKLETFSMQDAVRSLLTVGVKPEYTVGGDIYSQLSGVAHAAASALGMYYESDDAKLVMRPEMLTEQAGYLFVASTVVAENWLDVFEADGRERERWRTSRGEAERSLRRLI